MNTLNGRKNLLAYNTDMDTLTGNVKQVLEKAEVVTIATSGEKGPHLVATWGDFVRTLDIDDGKTIVIPTGGYEQTEKNLERVSQVEVMIGSKEVMGKNNMGTGFRLKGRAKILTEGKLMELVKSKYSWARAALVIVVEKVEQLL